MAVDNTYTSATFDAYITAAECDTLIDAMAGLMDSTIYDGLSTTKKENLIKYATRELNQFEFEGYVSSDVVAGGMEWPRIGVYYSNSVLVDSESIPDFVKRFTAYRVIELAANNLQTTKENELHTKKIDADGVNIEFFDPKGTPEPSTQLEDLPAYLEIAPYVLGGGDYEVVRA
jgi:hypothetical protein